jgi:hypothetical protein
MNLFDMTPEALQQQRAAALDTAAQSYARQDAQSRADAAGYQFGNIAARGIGSAMGVEDKELLKVRDIQGMMKGIDRNDPEALLELSKALGQKGYMAEGEMAWNKAKDLEKKIGEASKARTEASKSALSLAQEEKLRAELAALGPDATNEQFLAVVRKYGKPDEVMKSIQTSQDKAAAADAKIEAATVTAQAALERAREQGATALQLKQMSIDSAQMIAGMMAGLKRELAANKPESPASLKAKEKADAKEEGKLGLSSSLDRADALVDDIYKEGGMTSTAKSPLSNLLISTGTGTVGQYVGQKIGSKAQAKRDELASVRSQILNDVKEATGMSASQMNSNVELQLWLKSLGGEWMTKEANKAIINNIKNKYVNKAAPNASSPDNEAVTWAKANPNDPRAAKILQINGVK